MAQKQEKSSTSAVVPQNEPTAMVVHDYGDDEGGGYEHQTKYDSSIPFLVCLQPGSPQVLEAKGGARAGMIWNSVTDQLWDGKDGVTFVPATTRHSYTEFVPREKGGGFKGQHELESGVITKARANGAFGKLHTPDGNELVETFYVYGVICDKDGQAESMAVIAFTSTKIKTYKKWMTTLRSYQAPQADGSRVSPPLFAHVSILGTETQKNDKGTFHVFTARPAKGSVAESLIGREDPRYIMAKACRALVDAGAAKVDYSKQGGGSGADEEAAPF
jgi:hypothetical protein